MRGRTRRFVSSWSIKPIVARFLLMAVLVSASSRAAADVPTSSALSEAEAVSRALARGPLAEALEAQSEIQDGQQQVASAYPNPEVAYMREQTFGVAGTSEDYVSLSQTIDLGNRRGVRGEAAAASADAVRQEAEGQRRELMSEARRRFYQVLYGQE